MANIFEDIYKSFIDKAVKQNTTPSNSQNNVETQLKQNNPLNLGLSTTVATRNTNNVASGVLNVIENASKARNTAIDLISAASKVNRDTRAQVGLKSPAGEITNTVNKAVTGALNYLQESNKGLSEIEQNHLDAASSAYLDTSDVLNRIKADNNYYNTLFSNDGTPIDYSNEIIRLQETASNQFNNEDRKAAKQQLDMYKQYQADQKKMIYSSQYQSLLNQGADQDTLNQFKKAVIQDNYNAAERIVANFGSTVESFVGSQLNAYQTLTATASKLMGNEPMMSDYPSQIIQDAENLQAIIMSNANGAEQVAYKVYNGMAPFLYSLALSGIGSQSFLGNEAAAKALTGRALLISDASVLGSQMKENMANGYDFSTSVTNAFLHAALSHITESIGGEALANVLTGEIGVQLLDNYLSYAIRSMANTFLAEATEEGMEALFEPIIDKYTLNTGLTVEGYIQQVFSKDTLEQMLIGGLGGLVMGAGGTAKTIIEFDNGVKQLMGTINIENQSDYASVKEATEFFEKMANETQNKLVSGQIAKESINDTNKQLYIMKQLNQAFSSKLNEYKLSNPYADAFKPVEDVQNKLSENPEQDIIKAAAPTIKQNVDDLVTAKQNYIQSTNELNSVVQQQLANKGITIDVIEYNNLTDDAKRQVELTSKYSQKLKSNVVFANIITKSGQVLDGLYNPETRQIIINPNAKTGALTAYVHEITHNTEGSAFYSLLKMLVKETYGDEYADNIKAIQDEYSTLTRLSEEDAEKELVAITTQSLLDNEQFMDRLVRYNTSLAYQMYEEIKYISQTTGTALDAIEQNFMRAFSTKGTVENQSNDLQFLFMGEKALNNLKKEYKDAYDYVNGQFKLAKRMEGKYSPKEIFAKTSFFRDPTGVWKFEVLEDYDYIANHFPTENGTYLLKDIYGPNSQIFAFYPELANLEVVLDNKDGSKGVYKNKENKIYLHAGATAETIIHEVQHFIQWKEGFKTGSSYSKQANYLEQDAILNKAFGLISFNKQLIELSNLQKQMLTNDEYLYNRYKYTAGEVEARDSALRSKLKNEGVNIDNIIPAMLDENIVSEIKKYYDLGDEKSIARIIKNIMDNFNSSDNSFSSDSYSMEQVSTEEIGRGGRGLEFSKGLTIEDLGRNKDLVAAHNLSEDKFLASINLGGFVFPSVAVTKDSVGHENYGDITLLFDKKTIDPSNRNNRVYSGDAWTPTYPTVDYDVDTNTTQAISKQLNDIVDFDSIRSLDNNYFLYNLQNGSQLNDALNEHRGDISTLASDNNALKYIFLTKSGQNIEIPRKPKELNLKGNYTKGRDVSNYVLDALLNSGYTAGSFYDMSFEERTNAYYDVIKNAIANYYNKAYSALQGGQFGTNLVEDFDNYSADYILEQVDQYLRTANEGVIDIQGLKANLNNAIIQYGDNFENDFADWIRNNITSKIRYNTGIRNDKDMFTPSGNRRSFAQLHDPYTAQNVLKYMKKQTGNDLRGAKNDSWGVGPGEIISTQLKEFRSIDEIIQNEGLIKNLNDEEFNQTYKTVYDSIYAISKEISSYIEAETGSTNYFELNDSSLQLIKDCMRKNNKKQMYDLYMKEFYPYANFKMSEENVSKAIDAIYGLKESIGDLPTRYFEAKPMRIVGLDEIQLAIIPNNSSDYLKETLNNLGINYVEYDPSIEGSRQSIIQAQDNLKFSKGLTMEDLKAQANLDKNKKSLKRYYSEVLGANLRRSSLGINELLDLATKDIRDNGSISEGVYNRLKESVWESTKVLQGNDYADSAAIRKFLKENPIEITQMEERDRMYLQKHFGSIGFKKGGNSFDTVMMEFNDLFPGLINIDNITSAKDFVDQVSSVLTNIDKSKDYIVPGTEAGISEEEIYNDFSTKFDDAMANYTNDVSRITVVDKTEEVLEDNWKQNTQQVLNQIGDEELTVDNIDSILKHKKVSNRTLEAMERNKQMMIDNAEEWIKGYDTLREEFPLYSKETFSNACFETLVYGDISDETREKMYNALSSMYDFENVLPDYEKDVNDFINEALTTFSNETKYKAGEIDMEPIRKAMKINEAYNGQTIEADTERFKNNTYLNNITSKFKDQLKKSWQPIVNDLLSLSTQSAEKTGKKLDRVISRYKTIDQNIDALCHGNLDLKTKMQNEIRYNLLDEAAKTKSDVLTYAQDVVNKIKDLGITEGSRENIAVQYILEGHTETVRSDLDLGDNTTQETINEFRSHPFEAYTLEDLKRDYNYQMENGRLAWENIVDAANLLKTSYDDIYKEITDSQLLANGDVEGNMDLALADAKTKVEQAFKVMYNIKEEIKLNGSKESTQAAYELAKSKYNRLVNQYNALVNRDAKGDATRRQLTPYRENFSHHIVKRSLKSSLQSIKNAELMTPTQLAGISEITEPNTMWATFSAAQDSLVYDPNALGSFTEYMKEAANVVSYNPVIISLRQLTRDIQATAQNRQLNKFVEYLTDYTNMLSGKRLGIDREVQKFVGDKGMRIISTLNSYAKAAALTGNVRSALVQFANIPSGLSNLQTSGGKGWIADVANGIKRTINNINTIDQSPFMANRYFDFDTGKSGVMNSLDDMTKTMLTVGDKVGAQIIWNSAYAQYERLKSQGADLKVDPIKYADDITRTSVAGRTKEDMAVAMNSQVLNLLFPFQVENNNLYQNLKQQLKTGNGGAIITYGVSAYLFNAIIKAIMNSDDEVLPEFITPIVDEVIKGLKGEQGADETVQNALFGEIGEMISLTPVGSQLLGLALNNDKAEELFGDYNPSRYGTTNIGLVGVGNIITSLNNDNTRIALADAISDLISGYVKGGKQLTRTTEGLQSMGGLPKLDAEGNVVMTPVNYTSTGRIAFVNDQTSVPDWIRAALFGKWSTDPAREYIDSDFKSMSEKEQRIFELLNNSGSDTNDSYNTAKEYTELTKQAKEDETIDSSLRDTLIQNGTYGDYMDNLTDAYEKYLETFDFDGENEPKTFKQFASGYGITADDLKADTYQGFYDLYDLTEEQQKAFSDALDIENSVNALGKTISNSAATQRRVIYEQQGIYNDILEFIEECNLDYSDFGLTKTVVGYTQSQINKMLEKIGLEPNYQGGSTAEASGSKSKGSATSGSKGRKTSGSKTSGSRLTKTQKNALLSFLKTIQSSYKDFGSIVKGMTSVSDAKAKAEKIRNSAYKG